MKYCFKSGLYLQGILHDLSKFTPVEFFSSVKYFNGKKSPTECERDNLGYSLAWLNHKGRNKHHWEYWIDHELKFDSSRMPEKYVYEMVCDQIGAGQVYMGKEWKQSSPLEYHLSCKNRRGLHPETLELFEMILIFIKDNGVDDICFLMKNKIFKYSKGV